jgi:iron(III) transport system ATP-binding protein
VYVTHDQAEAMALASHIAVMNKGELMQWGAPQTLYQHPDNAWVAGLSARAILFR